MPKYMTRVSFTREGVKGLQKEKATQRRAAVLPARPGRLVTWPRSESCQNGGAGQMAALAAGLILGALGSRLFFRPPAPPPPVEDVVPVAVVQEAEPAPPPPPPEPEPEPARVSMEDVVSELERRYEGRQADATGEKRAGGRRRRPGR